MLVNVDSPMRLEGLWIDLHQLPMKIAHLLPNLSLMIGTKGNEQIAPREYMDPMMPCKAPVGWLKNSFHASTIWTALIICESKPDVISIPMHVGKRSRYRVRRFGFLYHGTRSCSTAWVRTGSAAPVAFFAPEPMAMLTVSCRISVIQVKPEDAPKEA